MVDVRRRQGKRNSLQYNPAIILYLRRIRLFFLCSINFFKSRNRTQCSGPGKYTKSSMYKCTCKEQQTRQQRQPRQQQKRHHNCIVEVECVKSFFNNPSSIRCYYCYYSGYFYVFFFCSTRILCLSLHRFLHSTGAWIGSDERAGERRDRRQKCEQHTK